jgi:hypothetical protein
LILIANLEGQLTGVAHNQNRSFPSDRLNLLQRAEDEDGGLSETRLGLTENIGSEDGLWDADLLDCLIENVRVRSSKCVMNVSKPSEERPFNVSFMGSLPYVKAIYALSRVRKQ